jgi:LPXTG-site transpeptidase (sortase) family protein
MPTPATAKPVGAPKQLLIPRIGVRATIERTEMTKAGILLPPKSAHRVGWFKLSAVPGFRGNSVMAGHLDWYSGPGVFIHLARVKVGDTITVVNDFGKKISYRVREVRTYRNNQVPLQRIVGPSKGYHLNLYTCAGFYNRLSRNYSHRVVVYTDQIRPVVKK